jgi:dihydrofolate reductase/thymidylate synthase
MRGFRVIVAYQLFDNGIGCSGSIPWNIPEDKSFFANETTTVLEPKKKNAVIMGRLTWESIPAKWRPLKNRVNIIITSKPDSIKTEEGVVYAVDSLASAIEVCAKNPEIESVFIGGGQKIYEEAIAFDEVVNEERWLCTKVDATEIDVKDNKWYICDRVFPKLDENVWKKDRIGEELKSTKNGDAWRHIVYKRINYNKPKKPSKEEI